MIRVKGFKAMNIDMTCRDYQFEIGKTYEIDNDKKLELGTDSGFHFCLKLNNVFNYYDFKMCRLFEVEPIGDVVTGSKKSITKKLRIVRELTQEDLNNHKFTELHHDIWFKDRTDEELLFYKDDESLLVRKTVVDRMNDLNLMYQTFKDDKSWIVRESVKERMSKLV